MPEVKINSKDILELVEVANAKTSMGKVKKGVNEVTKAVDRASAKLVVVAEDVDPKEIVNHLNLLCKEKSIKLVTVPSKTDLGNAVDINSGCSCVAIISAGEGDGKELLMKVMENA